MATLVTSDGDTLARPTRFHYLEWSPVIVGALGAAAISIVLFTFGSAIGLSAVSPYPYAGMSAATFFVVAALYTALVQVGSFAAGGYLAGRMRTPWATGVESERHFRDGSHGFAVWALCILIGVCIAVSGASGVLKTAVQTTATVSAGAAIGAGSALGNASMGNRMAGNRVAVEPTDIAIDLLLRPGLGAPAARMAPVPAPAPAATPAAPAAPAGTTEAAPTPAPAAPVQLQGTARVEGMAMEGNRDSRQDLQEPLTRVFSSSLRDGSLAARDRTYLAQVVSRQTGLSQAESEKRVDEAYAEAKTAEAKARDAANQARKYGALAAFLAAATLLIACAAACAGAALGGRHRDEQTPVRLFGASRFW